MKPKHRVYCPGAGRPKMLFESEAKAKRCIEFNKDEPEFTGRTLRAYHCDCCGGWHITSARERRHHGTMSRLDFYFKIWEDYQGMRREKRELYRIKRKQEKEYGNGKISYQIE